MRRKFLYAAAAAILLSGTLGSCKKAFEDPDLTYDPDSEKTQVDIITNSDEDLNNVVAATVEETPADFEFALDTPNKIIGSGSSIKVEGTGSSVNGSIVTISKSGCYKLEGSILDGRVVVDLDKADKGVVKLILNGVSYSSSGGAAIKIKTCPKASFLLADGTNNKLTSSAMADTSAAIQSSQNLYFSAGSAQTGKLTISAKKNQAIKTSDGVVIKSGTYSIISELNDGIQAKDFIKVDGGDITIKAAQHGLKTTSTKENKGFVYISGGKFNLTSTNTGVDGKDAIHAEGSINILSGKFVLQSADDGISSGAHIIIKDGDFKIDKSDKCITALGNITIDGGVFSLNPTAVKTSSESGSGHGISVKKLEVNGVKTNRVGSVFINGGDIDILQSYEGVQGVSVTVTGGVLRINSLDDAINASDGSSQEPGGFGGRPGMVDPKPSSSDIGVFIKGGLVIIKTQGDGIDSNGKLEISDGVLLLSQNGRGNETLDAGDGQEPSISGGVVVALGDKGMSSAPKATQTAFFVDAQGSNDSYFAVNDANGNNILAWKVPYAYQVATVSSPKLASGSYTYITNASVKGDEYLTGSNFYYPAKTVSGNGTSITLEKGKCVSTVAGGRPNGGW